MKNKAAVELGKKGGSVTTASKADAARMNGRAGGRPNAKIAEAARYLRAEQEIPTEIGKQLQRITNWRDLLDREVERQNKAAKPIRWNQMPRLRATLVPV